MNKKKFILGIGTNLGDSLNNLRVCLRLLGQLEGISILNVSPVYTSVALLPVGAARSWDKSYLNLAVCGTTAYSPLLLLRKIKRLEKELGRSDKRDRWAPRIIDIDILAIENQVITEKDLNIPHADLLHRPFALWPLLDLWPNWSHPTRPWALLEALKSWGDRQGGKAPFNTRPIPHVLGQGCLVGILNITSDSFSDGGKFLTPTSAFNHAKKLFCEGAQVIDIGAESTRPGATPVSAQQEWSLLEPVLKVIFTYWKNKSFKPQISIDTYHAEIAEKALIYGVDYINDVSGLADKSMQGVIAESGVKCIMMHNLGVPVDKKLIIPVGQDVVDVVLSWTLRKLDEILKVGIKQEQLILDVGIGFGKSAQQSIELINQISRFHFLGLPLMVGHSRKSFLSRGKKLSLTEKDEETALISYELSRKGVDYIRVHNIALNIKSFNTTKN